MEERSGLWNLYITIKGALSRGEGERGGSSWGTLIGGTRNAGVKVSSFNDIMVRGQRNERHRRHEVMETSKVLKEMPSLRGEYSRVK